MHIQKSSPRKRLRVVMAQRNPLVGDIAGNTELLIRTVEQALVEQAPDMVVFPELMLTAYPPEDLLLRPSLDRRVQRALDAIRERDFPLYVVVGYPGRVDGRLYNMLAVIRGREVLCTYRKQCLPNYQVFDEKRYFARGDAPSVLDIEGLPVAFTICEDLWQDGPMTQAAAAGARLMININGSPFHRNKSREREDVLRRRCAEGRMPVIYVNQVGGQDELVFDGDSIAMDAKGEVRVRAPLYEAGLVPVDIEVDADGQPRVLAGPVARSLDEVESVYDALVLGLRDYVRKNGFPGVVLGLSGGIDSALSLAIAVDALGADKVEAVMMPFRYTARISEEDAESEARALGVRYRVLPIEGPYQAFVDALAVEFRSEGAGVTEQNLQARCRGVLLMAISNKKHVLVLTTGNKSELAVGYSTLYGDMAGGFDVLKDVPKTLVFRLCEYRNSLGDGEIIPQRVIDRPPSAELAPGQKDEDSLPPYPVLDEILKLYIEYDLSANAIIAEGFDADTVRRVLRLVDLNEYKRRQAAVGPRITQRGFGRDRRYPITSGWRLGD